LYGQTVVRDLGNTTRTFLTNKKRGSQVVRTHRGVEKRLAAFQREQVVQERIAVDGIL
jgi:hypothetical protein